jgi:hypothetical protein
LICQAPLKPEHLPPRPLSGTKGEALSKRQIDHPIETLHRLLFGGNHRSAEIVATMNGRLHFSGLHGFLLKL